MRFNPLVHGHYMATGEVKSMGELVRAEDRKNNKKKTKHQAAKPPVGVVVDLKLKNAGYKIDFSSDLAAAPASATPDLIADETSDNDSSRAGGGSIRDDSNCNAAATGGGESGDQLVVEEIDVSDEDDERVRKALAADEDEHDGNPFEPAEPTEPAEAEECEEPTEPEEPEEPRHKRKRPAAGSTADVRVAKRKRAQ